MIARYAATAILVLLAVHCAAEPRGSRGVVASASPEASAAGVRILEAGGNAVDAAVAVAFALGVTEPAGSGIGGQTSMLIARPGMEPVVINGSSRAPGTLPAMPDPESIRGHRASTVPTTVRVLDTALRDHGSGMVSWQQVLQPAIEYADEGYLLGHFRHRSLMRYADRLRESRVVAAEYLGANGEVPPVGARVRHPRLATTLKRLAEHGADDFYRGAIADEIAADMSTHDGWITADDLASLPEPEVTPPLKGRYRDYDVFSLPPPAGGWVVIQGLHLLDRIAPEELVPGRPERSIWLAETLNVVHGSRLRRPVRELEAFESEIAARTSPERAAELLRLIEPPRRAGGGETTHFSVSDASGAMVAVTASLNAYFGAREAAPTLGFLYNDYMHEFELEQTDNPFYLRPGGLPYSSMSATVLARDAIPVLAVGSPGSKRIISAVLQVVSSWVDGGRNIESAVAAPRMHVVPDEELFLEARGSAYPAATLLALELRGYTIMRPLSSLYKGDLNPYFGGVHAVAREGDGWTGAADPRRDGAVRTARGYGDD